MKNKNIIITAVIILSLLISSVAGYFFFIRGGSDSLLTIGGLYGPDGNLIQKGLSVVGGVEGVKYITLKINVNNKDTVPLTFSIRSLDPVEIDSKKPIGSIEIQPDGKGSFTTDLIDIELYEGGLQEFCVTVYSHKITALREESENFGCISVQIDPNPLGNFDISLESSVGDSAVNPGCTESWQCSEWSSCANLIQTRTCTELNNCDTTII